jgi:hypothetical protein
MAAPSKKISFQNLNHWKYVLSTNSPPSRKQKRKTMRRGISAEKERKESCSAATQANKSPFHVCTPRNEDGRCNLTFLEADLFSYDPGQKQKEGKRGRSEVDINLDELVPKTCEVISGTKSILSFSRDIMV